MGDTYNVTATNNMHMHTKQYFVSQFALLSTQAVSHD